MVVTGTRYSALQNAHLIAFSNLHSNPIRLILSSSVQFSVSVMSTYCYSMDYSTPGFPVHHQLPELAQIHVHHIGDAIQPSQPLLSPSPPAFNLYQHQGLFQGVCSSHQVAKVLEFQLHHHPHFIRRIWILRKL